MSGETLPSRWLSVEALLPGMVLARPIASAQRRVLDLKLGAGTCLTDGMIAQLAGRSVECVAVIDPDPLPPDDYERLCKAHRERLLTIFRVPSSAEISADGASLYQTLLRIGPHR